MAVQGEVLLRLRVCFGNECRAVFFLCSRCDRGQRYCSLACRERARVEQRRRANRRHQQSPEGRLDHRDRQRAYRERCRHRALQASLTDQGSLSTVCPASSGCGKPTSRTLLPHWPAKHCWTDTREWLRCRICGRAGRFIDPFPHLPRGR
jgi:hypothetical protein